MLDELENTTYIADMLENTTNKSIAVRISISQKEFKTVKLLVKQKGMTFQGWLGQLVKRELALSIGEQKLPPLKSESVDKALD